MNRPTTTSFKSAQQGVVLIEAMIAILLFSMGVLAVVGLQAAMIKNTADSQYRTEASYIAQQKIGQMWADPAGALAGDYNKTYDVTGVLPNGLLTVTAPLVVDQFVVTVTWQQPGEAQHNFTITASIAGG
jgi:type IV pilus assembly protein PilV